MLSEEGDKMKRDFEVKGIRFHLGNYTPRRNEFERGLKYQLYVDGIPTGYKFNTLKEGKAYATKNYFSWL